MKIITLLLILILPSSLMAEEYDTMYGFSLGEPIAHVLKKLGEPDEFIELENGFKVRMFASDDHYAVFISRPNNDLINSIQVTSFPSREQSLDKWYDSSTDTTDNTLSTEYSLISICLGDPFEKVLKKLGKPTLSRAATDGITNEEVENTNIHFYGRNYSVEESNGKITSMKIEAKPYFTE